jgi:hypothetical protein
LRQEAERGKWVISGYERNEMDSQQDSESHKNRCEVPDFKIPLLYLSLVEVDADEGETKL